MNNFVGKNRLLELRLLLILMAGLLFSANIKAAENFNITGEGVGLHGYDPVTYFAGVPTAGNARLNYTYQGVAYYFSSQESLDVFKQAPNTYAPEFGGYCAYGVRLGKKFDIDPDAYAIEDGKLYVLLNRATKMMWDKDRERNIAIAERIWPSIETMPASSLDDPKKSAGKVR